VSRKPTIHDVARKAGVSIATVSYVINGSRAVGAERRGRIEQAIAELGYFRNGLAQSLKSETSRVIGVSLPYAASAYFHGLMEALEDIAESEGFEILQILSRQDPERELRRIETLLAHRVAGLIMVPSYDPHRTFDLLHRSRAPVVMVDRLWPDDRFDYVTMNNREAMTGVVDALIGLGHRALLFTARFPNLITTQQRIEAFKAAGGDARVEFLLTGDDEETFGARLIERLRRPLPPTALIASNSIITLWALKALQAAGVSCPDDLSIVSFDEPVWADVLTPPLSIIRHPTRVIAEAAWGLLTERIEEARAGELGRRKTRHLEFSATLELRGSVTRLA